jgi:HK97 family phage major capsid protein
MREILDNPEGEDNQLDSAQAEEFDRLHEAQEEKFAEAKEIEEREEAQRAREDGLRQTEDWLKQSKGVKAGDQDTRSMDLDDEEEAKEEDGKKYARAFDLYLRYGVGALEPEYQSVLSTGFSGFDARDAYTPEGLRAQSVGQDTKGGFLVPEGFFNQIIEATLQFGGMRQARTTILTTSSGQDLPIPTDNDTSNTGAILPENTTDSEQDLTFGQTVLHAYMYTSKIVKVSRQLLQDSAFDVQAFLTRKLGERIGRITNTHFTTGDAAAKPQGITVGATSGVTAASATDFTVDELLDLKHAVDPSYRASPQWMFKDATLLILKKKKDGEGRPLWQSGIAMGDPNTIDGDPYVINEQMPTVASAALPIAYGDFSLYYIRDVLGIQLLRLDERYADALQVGFLAFSRHDGVLVDAGTNPVKVMTMA